MDTPVTALISTMQFHGTLSTGRHSLLGVVEAASRLGAGGVEFRPDYWREKERDIVSMRRAIGARGLVATYATFAMLFNAEPSGDESLRRDVDDAVALGSPLLRVFLGAAPDDAEDPAWDRARRLVDYAAERGIALALENFARAPGCRVGEIARTLDTIRAPALRTNVDVGNYALNGEDIPAAVRTFGERVMASHLKDANDAGATYLGGGSLPLPAILDAFAALPQPVLHGFEFEGGDDPEGRIAASLAYLRAWDGR